jgi:hypothetical protein
MPRFTRALVPALVPLVTAGLVISAPPATSAEVATKAKVHRTIEDRSIVESSGLARSTYDRGLLWTHNDSGGNPRVFAVGGNGRTRATVTLRGAKARDWEDIAAGPGRHLWVGDIGNNAKRRSVITAYRFTEPKRLKKSMSLRATSFDLRYPDGKHNAEGIMVHPKTGRLYVVSKSTRGGAVYRAPKRLSSSKVNKMKRVMSVPKKVTAASFSPDGKSFVVGNYSKAWIYKSFGGHGRQIDKPSLRQGESIEYSRNGRTIFMGSEGRRSPIYAVTVRR